MKCLYCEREIEWDGDAWGEVDDFLLPAVCAEHPAEAGDLSRHHPDLRSLEAVEAWLDS